MRIIKKLFRKSFFLILIFNLIFIQSHVIGASNKKLPSGLKYEDLPGAIENYVNENKETTCGMNVIVYDQDDIVYQNSFGYMDKALNLKSEPDTVYEWGSISKLFIWVSIMQLYEDGKIDLNADIKSYLPKDFLKNLSFDTPITIIDLMNHKAGFQDTYFIQTTDIIDTKSLEDALKFRQPKQVYAPGEHTAYSNWSATLAAFIVQRISGMDYVDYVHKNIFEPLDMKHTSISPTYSDNPWVLSQRQKLKCYDINGKVIDGPGMYYIYLYPAGSAAGTINDLKKFARALTPDEKKPSPLFKNADTIKEVYTPTSFYSSTNIPKNFHGFFANEYGVQTIGHGGNTFGCSAMLQFDPVSGVGMVVMTNQAHETVYNYEMYELIFGKFKDSKLAKINRTVPKGLVLNTRGIIRGPLSFLGAMSVTSYDEEDLENWWYEENGILETQYSDFILSTPKALTNIMCIILFIVAGIYGIINLLVCAFNYFIKRKNELQKDSLRKDSYIISALMGLGLINLFIVFVRLNNGYRTGEIGSVTSYMLQSAIFAILLILIAVSVSHAKNKHYENSTKKEQRKFFITTLLAITQFMVIIIFEMYKFWRI